MYTIGYMVREGGGVVVQVYKTGWLDGRGSMTLLHNSKLFLFIYFVFCIFFKCLGRPIAFKAWSGSEKEVRLEIRGHMLVM